MSSVVPNRCPSALTHTDTDTHTQTYTPARTSPCATSWPASCHCSRAAVTVPSLTHRPEPRRSYRRFCETSLGRRRSARQRRHAAVQTMLHNKVPPDAVAAAGEGYALRKRLGAGAFASVYLATHRMTGRESQARIQTQTPGGRTRQHNMLQPGQGSLAQRCPRRCRCPLSTCSTRNVQTHNTFRLNRAPARRP